MSFKIKPIPSSIVNEMRVTMLSPQYKSLPAFSSVAKGYGPCRSCLNTFDEGNEDRTSFTYNPVDGVLELPQPGPVFVHTHECEAFCDEGFPIGIRGLPMLFEAFDQTGELRKRTAVETDNEASQIISLFSESSVDFIHIRNAEAGCYIARVERGL